MKNPIVSVYIFYFGRFSIKLTLLLHTRIGVMFGVRAPFKNAFLDEKEIFPFGPKFNMYCCVMDTY